MVTIPDAHTPAKALGAQIPVAVLAQLMPTTHQYRCSSGSGCMIKLNDKLAISDGDPGLQKEANAGNCGQAVRRSTCIPHVSK